MTDHDPARPLAVALIGAGAMGASLLKGWLRTGAIDPQRSAAFEPAPSADALGICARADLALNPPLAGAFDAMVLAIKPQALAAASTYAPIATNALVISVLAGKSVAAVAAVLGGAPRVVRAMPNMGAMVGKGVSGIYAPGAISAGDRAMTRLLMAAVGPAVFVDTEDGIDAVTAISGSGPAYFFLMAEALEEAARGLGLPPEAARLLARQTLVGAGAVVEADARAVSALRRTVASPGGTTEAALKVLDGDRKALRTLIDEAAAAARRRALDLKD